MKKCVLLILLLIFALALCACDKRQIEDSPQDDAIIQTPADNTPVDPDPSEKETEAAKSITQGYSFIYKGEISWEDCVPDLSGCVMDALYYVDSVTEEVYLISEGPVTELSQSITKVYGNTRIFFVTAAEPDKVYATTPKEHTRHTLVFQSDSGPVTHVSPGAAPFAQSALQLVINSKQFVWLDLATGEASVVMEQYYMDYAHFSDVIPHAKSWRDFNEVYFEGKLRENEPLRHYYYWIDQDKTEEISYE